MSADNSYSQILWQLLLKEIDVIRDTVKNLDEIIHKTKNFAFFAWGGSLFLFAEHIDDKQQVKPWLILLSSIIPLLFWMIDSRWREYLLRCKERERVISHFLNSEDFEQMIQRGEKLPKGKNFPFYDPVGWFYTDEQNKKTVFDGHFHPNHLFNDKSVHWHKVFFYKDAFLFYGALMLFSIVFGVISLNIKN